MSHCPQGLDIPALLALYNEHCVTDGGFIAPMALSAIPEEKRRALVLDAAAVKPSVLSKLKSQRQWPILLGN